MDLANAIAAAGSFNPCCFGLVVKTTIQFWWTSFAKEFQSLLFWIGREDPMIGDQVVAHDGFQSLLFWIGREDNLRDNLRANLREFQSLLFWIGREDPLTTMRYGDAQQVSILVVLDWS